MTSLWILFAVLHIVSIAFAMLSLQRLYHYIKRYRFNESKYTLLFSFVHLRWIAYAYVFMSIAWIIISYALFTYV